MKTTIQLLCFLVIATAFSQTNIYTPSWKTNDGKEPFAYGDVDSNGNPIGVWNYHKWPKGDKFDSYNPPEEIFDYDTYELKVMLEERLSSEGQLNSEFKRTGVWKQYHIDGSLFKTSIYKDGNSSEFNSFNSDGTLRETYKYDYYKKVGERKEYDPDGELILSEIYKYKDGMLNGAFLKIEQKRGYKIKVTGKYVNDNREGIIITEVIAGAEEYIYRKTPYKDGRIIGNEITYYKDGEVKIIETYDERESILVKHYSEDGAIVLIEERKNENEWEMMEYHPNGKIKSKSTYQNGGLRNILSLKDKDGNDLDFGTLKNGNGTLKEYSEEGTLELKKTIENGISHGKVEAFWSSDINGIQLYYKTTGNLKDGKKEGLFNTEVTKDGITTTSSTTKYFNDIAIEEKSYNLDGTLQYEFTINKDTGIKEEIYYYPSGAIRIKLQFKYPDTFLNVMISKDPNGEDLDYGSLKNGTGTYKVYDKNGKLDAIYTVEKGTIVAKE